MKATRGEITAPPTGPRLRESYADRIGTARAYPNWPKSSLRAVHTAGGPRNDINLVGGDPTAHFDQSAALAPFRSSVNHRTYVERLPHGASIHPPRLGRRSGFLLASSLH